MVRARLGLCREERGCVEMVNSWLGVVNRMYIYVYI